MCSVFSRHLRWQIVLALVLGMLTLPVFAADDTAAAYKLKPFLPDVLIINWSDMVPLQGMAEIAGATCAVDEATGAFTITSGDKTLVFTLDSKTAKINGTDTTLKSAPTKLGETVYAPVKELIEGLGGTTVRNNTDGSYYKITVPGVNGDLYLGYLERNFSAKDYKEAASEVYQVGLDGTNLRRLTFNRYRDPLPSFSSDGKRIISINTDYGWIVARTAENPRTIKLHPQPGVTDEMIQLAGNGPMTGGLVISSTQISPDGKQAAYTMGDQMTSFIFLHDLEKNQLTRIAEGYPPSFNSKGTAMTFSTGTGGDMEHMISMYNLTTREMREVTKMSQEAIFTSCDNPLFSPATAATSKILFQRRIFDQQTGNLKGAYIAVVTQSAKGMEINQTQEATLSYDFDAIFSPDGERIAFARMGSGIWTMAADRTDFKQLTTGKDSAPQYSADGQKIYFIRNSAPKNSKQAMLYNTLCSMNADGTDVKELLSTVTVSAFKFAPDNKSLILEAFPWAPMKDTFSPPSS